MTETDKIIDSFLSVMTDLGGKKSKIMHLGSEQKIIEFKEAINQQLILSGVGVSTSVTEKARDLIGGIFELTQKTNNGVMDLNRATDALYSFINQN
tara:strand:+ start:93 stop:380 length:288 start_codon:yes stop_codon:yes gene_type:complete